MAFGFDDVLGIIFTGGLYNAAKANNGGYDSHPTSTVTSSPPPDYSDAITIASDNGATVAKAQILSQQFQMQQAAMDRELQRGAALELSLEKFDTRMQTSLLQFKQGMTAEENRHVEKILADSAEHHRLTADRSETFADLPPPETE